MRFLLTVARGEVRYEGATTPLEHDGAFLAFHGSLFNAHELAEHLDVSAELTDAELTLLLVRKEGFIAACQRMHGCYNLVFRMGATVWVGVDPLGEHYPFWFSEGGECRVASDLARFARGRASVDPAWVSRYFAGDDRTHGNSPLRGIRRLEASLCLKIDVLTGNCETLAYGDPLSSVRAAAAGGGVSFEATVAEIERLLRANLRSVCRHSRRPFAFVSAGVDSVTLLALLRAEKIDFSAGSHARTELGAEPLESVRRVFTEYDLPLSGIRTIADRELLDFLRVDSFLQPCFHTWYVSFIYFGAHVEPALARGADLVLTGNFGDDVFLHRYRYVVTDLLERDHATADELRGLLARDETVEALRRARNLYARNGGTEADYAYSATELKIQELRGLLAGEHCSLADYALKTHGAYTGQSDDRPHRLFSGKRVVSIFADVRLLQLTLSLEPRARAVVMRTAGLQNAILERLGRSHGHFRKEASRMRYITNEKLFPLPAADWTGMLEELAGWDAAAGAHLARVLEAEPTDRANVELFRLFSFFRWLTQTGPG